MKAVTLLVVLSLACPLVAQNAVICNHLAEQKQLALEALFPRLGGINASFPDSPSQRKKYQETIDKIDKWLTGQPDRCVVFAYRYWLEFYQGELKKSESQAAQNERLKKFKATEKFPVPE